MTQRPASRYRLPRYVLVRDNEVAPNVLAMAREAVRRGAAELDLGVVPEIRWFADTRELPSDRVVTAREVFVPGDGDAKAGSIPPFVRFSPTDGWRPAAPVMMLNRTQCLPDTPLHELRHLWQIKAGQYRADEESTRALEDDADAWAAEALSRQGR